MSRRDLLSLDVRTDSADPGADYWIRVHRRAMACRFEVTLSGEDGRHLTAARAALDEVDRIEDALTVFRDSSELCRVNRHAGAEPVVVDRDLFDLLQLCHLLYTETERAFDITATPLSRCWGFLKRQGRLPPDDDIIAARACVGMEHVRLDEERRSVQFARASMELNLGSIGKGYALDRVARLLLAGGLRHALLSAGGSSVLALGGRDSGFRIDLRSRRAKGERLASLRLRSGALATSGAGEQFFEVDGKRYGHVLDPRTGWPAAGVLSASVVATSAAVADALSTAFLVGGVDLAQRYCAAHEDVLALITPEDETQPRVFGRFPGASLS